ncbi:MAG: PBP1A family penicillin-binding protein, partial [Patescibacteria group bacterium]
MPIKYIRNSSWQANREKPTRRRIVINRKSSKDDSFWSKFFRKNKIIKGLIILALVGILSLAILIFFLSRDLPNPNQLIQREVAQSTKIYDRTGENILYEIHGDQKRTLVSLTDIPNNVKNATIAIEDKNFYKHGGISVWAMLRTMVTNVIYGKSAGGSTLTQQFVKNAILSNEKTITRKIKEIILAQRIEKKFSKDEILQMYLNEIPYGSNAYGVEAAARKYFGKSVKDINLAEAAVLAALPQSPSRYSPYGANKDLLLSRQQYILDIMQEQKYISETERDDAKKTELKFAAPENNITAPHFIMYIKEILAEKYGEKTIEQGGLKIYTTLDLYKQKIAEEVVKTKSENYPKKYNANNAALVSIDPKTGQVLAMVGSRDYFNDEIDGQVNIATSLRQPGSSIKPLVYATLFNKGYTPNTILYDVITNFAAGGQAYEPHNYNGKEYGPVSIRQALAGSLNIPAVKAIYLAGIKNVITLAQDMGYTTLTDPDRYGLSLVLGGGEIKMVEHVNAFSAFAREGEFNPVSVILKIEDKDGKVLEEYKQKQKTVLSSQVAREINSILSDNDARTFIFGAKNYLTLPDRPVAAKTGTTNNYKDAWTIGYTPSLVTGVWVGNNDSKEMNQGADGSVVAAPIWNDFMKQVLTGTPVEQFKSPDDTKTGKAIIDGNTNIGRVIKINKETGLLATSSTPPELIEEKTFSEPHAILYYVNKEDPLGPAPSDPTADPQFNLWESRIIEWAKKNGL